MRLRSIVQCPLCGFKVTERMSLEAPLRAWTCPACQREVRVSVQDCCVFCRYGTVPCPKRQAEEGV